MFHQLMVVLIRKQISLVRIKLEASGLWLPPFVFVCYW